jgi:hypothetical protein
MRSTGSVALRQHLKSLISRCPFGALNKQSLFGVPQNSLNTSCLRFSLVSIARACGRSVPSGRHQGYAIEPSYPKGGSIAFLSNGTCNVEYVQHYMLRYNQINKVCSECPTRLDRTRLRSKRGALDCTRLWSKWEL